MDLVITRVAARAKEKAPGLCELRALLRDEPSSHVRSMAEGASPGTTGPCSPTPPAMLGRWTERTTLRRFSRRDRDRFRSLQWRVTTATPVPGNWTSCMAGRPTDM